MSPEIYLRFSNMNITNLCCLLATAFLFAGSAEAFESNPSTTSKTNIVFILADDLGYGELGCYGQKQIRTPNIDALANQGLRFTQHYTGAPVCAPARCVLMTGQHLGHAEIRGNRDSGNGRLYPGQWPLTDEVVTIAEVLRSSGYATGAFGKWGLGPSHSTGSPIKQGFDRYFGYNCQRNAHSYYPPFLDNDEKEQRINKYPIPGHDKKPNDDVVADDYRAQNYAPDLILREAIAFIDQHKDQPFFLYLPFVEPHVAMQPPQHWIDQYPTEWDDAHGPYRGQNGYLPHPRPRAAYAAMISDLDEHVGTILKRLDKHGLTDQTLVVFTSDNGPTHRSRDNRFHVGGAACTFFNSNGGLRGFKGSCYEGGIRVPCIVRWPGNVEPATTSNLPTYFPDWFPTLASIANGQLPKTQRMDGINLVEHLRGQQSPSRGEPMIWDFHGYQGIAAVRNGDWKIVRRRTRRPNPADWELYNLAKDRSETTNLADQYPEIVARLEKSFLANRTPEPDFRVPLFDNVKANKNR